MSFDEKEKTLALLLKSDLQLLKKSVEVLNYSYDQCKNLPQDGQRSPEQEEAMEALTARFSRTGDILTQKVIKNLLILLKEDIATFVDRAHFLEKIGVIERAQSLIDIRSLRNEVAHEYSSDLGNLFEGVICYTPILQKIIDRILAYLKGPFPFRSLLEES